MSRRIVAGILCVFILGLTGCRVRDMGSRIVVCRITVTTEQNGFLIRKEFSSPESMRQILGALRLLGQKATAGIDPEKLDSLGYCMTLLHTDGSADIVCTREDRFIRFGTLPWKQVDAAGITRLHLLLKNLPTEDSRHIKPPYLP